MMEYWNNGRVQFAFGGTRSVASGHDGAWPSRVSTLSFPVIPTFPYSNIPVSLQVNTLCQ
jgi:hypothetical protein